MSDQEVQIPLPITTVRKAWLRYIGAGTFTGDAGNEGWRSDDGRDLTATFTSEDAALTTLAVHGPDAAEGVKGPAELVEGFVAYVDAVHHELDAPPASTVGTAPVGPDGTPHMPDQPAGLGTDGRSTDDASTVVE